MSRSQAEGSSPIQPDGNLLSLVGDLIFAGVILVMIYLCLQKTVSRMDRQFFGQIVHVLEILLAVAALCFVLMLFIGQQMRIAYCSFIRPYVGKTEEDKAYVGMLLKISVCVLVMLNYFCASGLQRLVSYLTRGFRHAASARLDTWNVESQRSHYCPMFGDALSNNSNTNSQTPVTQTQSIMQSDILPSMSFPELTSEPCQSTAPTTERQRMYRDVGTMVRFPAPEVQHSSHCTLQFCTSPPHWPPITSSTTPRNTVLTSVPSTTTSRLLWSSPTASRGGRVQKNVSPSDCYSPQSQQSPAQCDARLASVQSSCHVHLEGFWKPNRKGSGHPRGQANFQCSSGKAQDSCMDGRNDQDDNVGVESDPSSIHSSNTTGTDSSSGVSNQSSFLSHVGLTSVLDNGKSPRFVLGVESRIQTASQPSSVLTGPSNVPHQPNSTQTQVSNVPSQIKTACTLPQKATPSVWIQSGGFDPVVIGNNCEIGHGPAIIQSHHSQGPCNIPAGNVNGTVASHPNSSSLADSCVVPSRQSSCHSHVVTGQCSHHSHVGTGQCSRHSHITARQCSCHTNLNFIPIVLPAIQKSAPTRTVKRRWRLPPMPKMTRSGKIYGYG